MEKKESAKNKNKYICLNGASRQRQKSTIVGQVKPNWKYEGGGI